MRLTAETMKLTRGRNWNRCAHCGRMLRSDDRVFFEKPGHELWCSVKCAEAKTLRLNA